MVCATRKSGSRYGDGVTGSPAVAGVKSPGQASTLTREAIVASSPVTVGSGSHHVLAVHGWFGSARGWGSLPEYLDGANYTYVFADLRGYGDRKQASGHFTMEEAAADAVALADELGWDSFSVVGHSMGGKIAHQVLLQAPSRVRALIGVNPVPAAAVPMDEQTWGLFHGAADNPGNRAAIIDFTTGSKLTKAFIDQLVRHSLDNSTVEAFAAYLLSWAKSDFSGQVTPGTTTVPTGTVPTNTVPVQVIVGETDPALSAAVMEQTWLTYFPGARLEVLANAGHYPMFETPVALATSIEGFLGRG
jgi:pimeloyl-ACP methyl ester carboxylesterase